MRSRSSSTACTASLPSAHNGNLVNAGEVRDALVREGAIFQTNSDTEVVVHLFARAKAEGAEAAIIEAMSQVRGAFSLVMMTKDRLIGARDPHGFRPLAIGRLGDAWVICSETCAMDLIGATYVRDVEPGEVVIVGPHGLRSVKPYPPARQSQCIFEHVYFSRPDSYVFGESVNEVRTEFGRRLARESGVPADVVVPIPDSGVCAAVGYAEASGLPMRMGLIRNHYVGRTFIQPQQSIRHFGVRVKLNPVRSILEGKRVVLVDDSIVRGTTSRKIVRMVRSAGAQGSAHADQLPADGVALLLRRRHAATLRADCRDAHARGDPQVCRRRQRRVSEPRRPDRRRERRQLKLLHLVLHGRLPGRVPARRGRVPAAGAQAQSRAARLSPNRTMPLLSFEKDPVVS